VPLRPLIVRRFRLSCLSPILCHRSVFRFLREPGYIFCQYTNQQAMPPPPGVL